MRMSEYLKLHDMELYKRVRKSRRNRQITWVVTWLVIIAVIAYGLLIPMHKYHETVNNPGFYGTIWGDKIVTSINTEVPLKDWKFYIKGCHDGQQVDVYYEDFPAKKVTMVLDHQEALTIEDKWDKYEMLWLIMAFAIFVIGGLRAQRHEAFYKKFESWYSTKTEDEDLSTFDPYMSEEAIRLRNKRGGA